MSGDRPRLRSRRVFAYVTWEGKLLVREEIDHPDAGLQVPGRPAEPGASPAGVAVREVREAAGLDKVTLQSKLGHYQHDMSPVRDVIEERHVYWISYHGNGRRSWRSVGASGPEPSPEMYYWVEVNDAPTLRGDQGAYLSQLELRLYQRAQPGVSSPNLSPLTESPQATLQEAFESLDISD